MKRKIAIGSAIAGFIALFLYFSFNQIGPLEIENAPDWMTVDDAMQKAASADEDRLILIDIFEVGCRFCRQMEREVYPSESIRMLIDNRFYPVKVNGNSSSPMVFKGETITEQEFAARMGVTAYPFTVVMDADGNVLNRRRGFMGVSELSRFLNTTLRELES